MQGLSEKDRAMMGIKSPESEGGPKMEAVKQEAEQAMVSAFGSVESARKYAKMELTSQIQNPNPDAGMEEGLADKIRIARNLTYVYEGGDGNQSSVEQTLMSTKTSAGFAKLSRRN